VVASGLRITNSVHFVETKIMRIKIYTSSGHLVKDMITDGISFDIIVRDAIDKDEIVVVSPNDIDTDNPI
jgi:hypothetical protein